MAAESTAESPDSSGVVTVGSESGSDSHDVKEKNSVRINDRFKSACFVVMSLFRDDT